MSRAVAATSATVLSDAAFQMYVDQMQQLLLDSTVEMQYVARGIGRRLSRTAPKHNASDSQVRGAAASIRRDTKRAALALSVAASLLARADAVHTEMFMDRPKSGSRNGGGTRQQNSNGQGNNGRQRNGGQRNGRQRSSNRSAA